MLHLHGILFRIFAFCIHINRDIRQLVVGPGHTTPRRRRRRLTIPPIPRMVRTLPLPGVVLGIRIRRVPSSRMLYIRTSPHDDISSITPASALGAAVEVRPDESDDRSEAGETGAHDADVELDGGPGCGADVVPGYIGAVGDDVEAVEAEHGGYAAAVSENGKSV